MTTCYLLMLFLFFSPIEYIELDTEGRGIFNIRENMSQVFADESFLIVTKYRIYHFDRLGKPIQAIGSKGSGPGEFGIISAATWTGEHYLVCDGYRLQTSLFNQQGSFLWRSKDYYDNLYANAGTVLFNMGDAIDQYRGERPNMIGELRLADRHIEEGSARFHPLSQEVVNLFYNYSKHHIASHQDTIHVMDELRPFLASYRKDNHHQIKEQPLKLTGFVPAPAAIPKRFDKQIFDREAYQVWQNSWSRIIGLAVTDQAILIAYTRPDTSSEVFTHALAIIDRKTSSSHSIDLGSALFMGASNNRYLIFHDWAEETSEPLYSAEWHAIATHLNVSQGRTSPQEETL